MLKRLVIPVLILILTATPAFALTIGPAHPEIVHANIHGVTLGSSPSTVLSVLRRQHAQDVGITRVFCERQRIASLKAGNSELWNGEGEPPPCISEITADFGRSHISVEFLEDITAPSFPVVAYEIQYRYVVTTMADAEAVYSALITKYGTPTVREGDNPSIMAKWVPICGLQVWADGTKSDPCTSIWAATEIAYMHVSPFTNTLYLENPPLASKVSKARTALESRVQTDKTSF